MQFTPRIRIVEIIGFRDDKCQRVNRVAALQTSVTLRAGLREHRIAERAYPCLRCGIPFHVAVDGVFESDGTDVRAVLNRPPIERIRVLVITHRIPFLKVIGRMDEEVQLVDRVAAFEGREAFFLLAGTLFGFELHEEDGVFFDDFSVKGTLALFAPEDFSVIERILVIAQMNRIHKTEGIADKDLKGHQ